MTLTFDQAAYRKLLAEVAPKVIETEEEYGDFQEFLFPPFLGGGIYPIARQLSQLILL